MKTAIDALPRYDQTGTCWPIGIKPHGRYLLRDDVLAALAPTVQDAEPAGWVQYINGVQTQNFARDQQELAQIQDVFRIMKTAGAAEYRPVYYAAPTPQAAPTVDYPGRIEGMTDDTPHIQRMIDEAAPTVQGSVDGTIVPWTDRLYLDAATWGDELVAMALEIADLRAALAQRAAVAEVASDGGICGPLTDAQRTHLRHLYSNLHHLGPDAMEDVVRQAAVCGYVNGRKDFTPTARTPPAPEFTDEDKREQEYFDRWPDVTSPAPVEPMASLRDIVFDGPDDPHVPVPSEPAATSPLMQVAPRGWLCQRIQQNGRIDDYWEYYDAKAANHLRGEDGLRANDSMTNWTPLYAAPVPPAVAPEQSVRDALKQALCDMAALSPDELRVELDKHKDAPLAVALREASQFIYDRPPAMGSAALAPQSLLAASEASVRDAYRNAWFYAGTDQPAPAEEDSALHDALYRQSMGTDPE